MQCNVIRAHLNDSLKLALKCLDQLDTEISRLLAALDQLMGQRERLCDEIAAHKALVSPARRMPRDIMQEIFIACLPTDRNPVMASAEAPILLGHICDAWRHISLSTPRLWSSLHIVIPANAERAKQLSELVKIWFGCSGGLPLSITVVLSHTFNESMSATDIFATLKTFSRRWENMQFPLALATESLLELLSQIPMEDLPMLKNILLCS
ncbi:hypothetical protein B0H14DRAFT_595633 [Mycena olivaceomarginata]|nr:hypothetical protein B0H14DRAFT_595633 [Mycena olivaceomarginata]